jgi:hypothetical protein
LRNASKTGGKLRRGHRVVLLIGAVDTDDHVHKVNHTHWLMAGIRAQKKPQARRLGRRFLPHRSISLLVASVRGFRGTRYTRLIRDLELGVQAFSRPKMRFELRSKRTVRLRGYYAEVV